LVVLRSWLAPDAITFDTIDSRPVISAKQPVTPSWQGTLDNSGYDVSFPQCGQQLSDASVGFAIIGVNYGRPFTANPCFATQWQWARTHDAVAVYINVSDPGSGTARQRGTRIVEDVIDRLPKNDVSMGTPVWLDIERDNSWTNSQRSVEVIQTVVTGLAKAGYPVGIYAAPTHWLEIAFNARVKIPVWLALGYYSSTAKGVADAKLACEESAFGDRPPAIVQFVSGDGTSRRDRNIMCSDPGGLVTRP
jgi:GH25 family lysozyme M1 (1,4-beta-N-acetylmuramidase)